MIINFTTRRNSLFHLVLIIVIMLLSFDGAKAQYSKNPLMQIGNEDYKMIVEKYVNIPDDNGRRPSINYMSFLGNRFFASSTAGKIYEIIDNGNNSINAELFFDVSAAISFSTDRNLSYLRNNSHSGLRAFAFHPDFINNGKIYTSLMEERPANPANHHYISDVSNPITADGVVVEWTYNFENSSVDSGSYREVFRVGVPYYDHPMKEIAFNRYAKPGDEDYGLLYISHGDGNIYSNPGTGLNNDARGKILRINPLQTDTTPYSIPSTNPFVNDTNWLDEIYALGQRNPHTLCFARDDSDRVHLISGNAGRDNIEEINVIKPGESYGWSQREGTYVQLPAGGVNTGIAALPDTDAVFGYTYPAAQWSRTDPAFTGYSSQSIAGGYVYTLPENGEKIFLSSDFPRSGLIMYNYLNELTSAKTKLDTANSSLDQPEELTQAKFYLLNVYFDDDKNTATEPVAKTSMFDLINDEPAFDNSGRSDIRFGQDSAENVYISSKRNGWIYKIQTIEKPATNFVPSIVNKGKFDFNVYPNPVNSDVLRVSFNEILANTASLSIISLDGRKVLQQNIQSGRKEYEINLTANKIKSGYYILQIESKKFSSKLNIIIK